MKPRLRARAWIAGAALAVAGCAGDPTVVRVYDGRIVEGAFVPSEAYAAYLRGVLAEEAADLKSALSAYEEAARADDEDPEPLTRIGDVQCRLDPKSKSADAAFARALKIDPGYAPARMAEARCALARGAPSEGISALGKVAVSDRTSVSLEALFVKIAAARASSPEDARARSRAIALTVASGESPASWDALTSWGRGKADYALLARGLIGLLRVAPARSREVEAGVLELLGAGQVSLAREVAAAIVDTPSDRGVAHVHDATVVRLAVDEALLAGDRARAERRATRGRVPLAEVAARALIAERADIAEPIARGLLEADPRSGGAAMVLAAILARGDKVSPFTSSLTNDQPPLACALVVAERLTTLGNREVARAWIARVHPSAMSPHDPMLGPLAVDLAARGALPDESLSMELRLELAARRREPPPVATSSSAERGELDAKHTLLWHVLVDPAGAPAKALLSRLHTSSDRDPIVGFSLVRAALASGDAKAWEPARRALASSPSHPLLLASALEIAKRAGKDDVPSARVRLMAVAQTPAERALAGEP